MRREKTRHPKCHSSALSQQDQNSSEIADIREFRMKKCSTRRMLHQTRAQSPDGTPAQPVERVKEGWGDVRASTGKRGTATQDLRISLAKRHPSHAGKCPFRRTSRTETRKREAPQFRVPRIKNIKKRQCVALATRGAVVLEDRPPIVVFILVRLGFLARLRAQWRNARAVVLRWSWVVMTEEEVALEVVEGGPPERSMACSGSGSVKRKRGGRKSGAGGAQMRRSGFKAHAPRRHSQRWVESTVGVRRRAGGEARKDDEGQDCEGRHQPGGGGGRTVPARMKRQDHRWIRKRREVARAKEAMEE
ncbi:hypothetical protein K438DRAFT_1945819 [Mycena galopus ATCC 62051]|nr:hypothetical protein K438DRAFT_1945819 [Mycena galopus ATCC 62051]